MCACVGVDARRFTLRSSAEVCSVHDAEARGLTMLTTLRIFAPDREVARLSGAE